MLKSVLTNIGLPGVLAAIIFAAGMWTQHKLTRACPECNCECPECPQPTVSIQPFDVEKIKNLKQFHYSPEFTGSISVAGIDSSSIKRYINEAIQETCGEKKRKRR